MRNEFWTKIVLNFLKLYLSLNRYRAILTCVDILQGYVKTFHVGLSNCVSNVTDDWFYYVLRLSESCIFLARYGSGRMKSYTFLWNLRSFGPYDFALFSPKLKKKLLCHYFSISNQTYYY